MTEISPRNGLFSLRMLSLWQKRAADGADRGGLATEEVGPRMGAGHRNGKAHKIWGRGGCPISEKQDRVKTCTAGREMPGQPAKGAARSPLPPEPSGRGNSPAAGPATGEVAGREIDYKPGGGAAGERKKRAPGRSFLLITAPAPPTAQGLRGALRGCPPGPAQRPALCRLRGWWACRRAPHAEARAGSRF